MGFRIAFAAFYLNSQSFTANPPDSNLFGFGSGESEFVKRNMILNSMKQ